MQYKLIDVIQTRMRFYVEESTKNGARRRGPLYLEPGKVYETDDPILIASLKGEQTRVKTNYRADLEQALKENGSDYEVTMCKVCGGKAKKIIYHAVEIVEE